MDVVRNLWLLSILILVANVTAADSGNLKNGAETEDLSNLKQYIRDLIDDVQEAEDTRAAAPIREKAKEPIIGQKALSPNFGEKDQSSNFGQNAKGKPDAPSAGQKDQEAPKDESKLLRELVAKVERAQSLDSEKDQAESMKQKDQAKPLSHLQKAVAQQRERQQKAREQRKLFKTGEITNEVRDTEALQKATRVCRGVTMMRQEGSIISPTNSNGFYPHNANCKWIIEAPEGMTVSMSVTLMSLEGPDSLGDCSYDKVTLYDGRQVTDDVLAVMCGDTSPNDLQSTGRYVRVVFKTDESYNSNGFIIEFVFVSEEVEPSTESCNGQHVLTSDSGTVTSAGFPDVDYPPYSMCSWKIVAPTDKVIHLTFTDFELEPETSCMYDSVTVYDGGANDSPQVGVYCEDTPLDFTSSSNQLYVFFESDESLEFTGFSFTYSFTDAEEGSNKPEAGCGDSGPAVLDHEEGSFSSPGLQEGENYPDSAQCSWRIVVPASERALLHFTTFALETGDYCQYDSVSIYDGMDDSDPLLGKYCGDSMPGDILASANVLLVTFESDVSIREPGFRAEFSGKEKDSGGGQGGGNNVRCGEPEVGAKSSRIVGGTVAVPHSWPWQISMRYRNSPSGLFGHWCGGSIIAPGWVITASHCLYGSGDEDDFKVIVGEHDLGSDTEPTVLTINVKRIILHENYNENSFDNDIALLELQESVTYSREVAPVCLPTADVPANTLCTTTGWGDTQGTGNDQLLHQVNVPVLDSNVCNQRDWYNGDVTTNMLCAGYPEGNKDSCQGDSGGPMVCTHGQKYRLYGLTSWGRGCAEEKQPGIYTKVARYLTWIENHTGVRP